MVQKSFHFTNSKYDLPIHLRIQQRVTRPLVFAISRIWSCWLNKTTVYHSDRLSEQLSTLDKNNRPLLTLSNHRSCLDDPVIWSGILSWKQLVRGRLRWIPAAREICFKNAFVSSLCTCAQLVPVNRGHGVYQDGMDFLISKMNDAAAWVHVFPEGKINLVDKKRLKWGIGRLIAECEVMPTVLPLWHVGMEDLLPNDKPFRHFPRFGKRLTIYVGEPIDLEEKLRELGDRLPDPMMMRKELTDTIQAELWKLRDIAEWLHSQAISLEHNPMLPDIRQSITDTTQVKLHTANKIVTDKVSKAS